MNLTEQEQEQALNVIHQLSLIGDYDEEAVLTALEGIGTNLFLALDGEPGHWGYKDPLTGGEWHWLLRQARNSAPSLFKTIVNV